MPASNENAHEWIQNDDIERVVATFPNFESLDLFVATSLIEADNPRVVIKNINIFNENQHDEIVRALAEKGYIWEVKDAFDNFTGARRSTLAEELITHRYGHTLTSESRKDERRELGVTVVLPEGQTPGKMCLGYYIARDRDEEHFDEAPYKLIVEIGGEFFIGDNPVDTLKQARRNPINTPGDMRESAVQDMLTTIFRAKPSLELGL